MKIHRTLFVRQNVPILAVLLGLLGFFGIGSDSVKEFFQCLVNPPKGEPFFCKLEDSTTIQNAQGDVFPTHGSDNFADGGVGCRPGFISRDKQDRVTFPVDGNLTCLKAGTIELCLTPQQGFKERTGDLTLFNTEPGRNAIILQISAPSSEEDGVHPTHLRLRVKRRTAFGGKDHGRLLSPPGSVEWKVRQHYHIAATWGEKGLQLYIDGKRAAEGPYTGAPKNLSGRFVVNNASTDPEDCDRPTYCIISNLVIHGAQLEPEDLGKRCSIREHWFPEK